MWLAILTLVSLGELVLMVAAAVMAFRWYRRATTAMSRLESEYLVPIATKVNLAVANVHDMSERVQHADEKVRAVVSRVEGIASHVSTFATTAWPVIGTLRAINAALGALVHRRRGGVPPRLSSRHAAHQR
jgi:hypothetical protein